jgi:hypothetical protein
VLIASSFLMTAGVFAQSGNEDFRIGSWSGGILESDWRLGIQSGAPGARSLGPVWSARHSSGPGSLFSNPALLALGGTTGFAIEGRTGLTNASFGFGKEALLSAERVQTATDDFLSDFDFASTSVPQYTALSGITAGQSGQLGALVVAHELASGFTLAGGYHRRASASAGLRMSGLETVLDAGRRSGAQTIDIDILAQLSAAAEFSLDLDQLALGTGIHLGTDDLGSWHAGFSILRRSAHANMNWSFQPGLMTVLSGSQQYFYNDPSDPNLAPGESNTLYWRARGHYRGRAWGARGGLRFATPDEVLVLSIAGNWSQDLTMNDPAAFAEGHLPIFVNLSGEVAPGPHEDELLDVEALNLAKPNLTRPTSDSLGTAMVFRQPSHLTFGVDLGLGPHTFTTNYVLYQGELSVEGTYGSDSGTPKTFRVGKALDYEIRAGLDFRFPDRIKGAGWLLLPLRLAFLDLDGLLFQALGGVTGYSDPHYSIGGGVASGSGIATGVERNIQADLFRLLDGTTPTGMALARRYTLLDRIDVGVTVAGIPDLFFRTAVTYRLP